MFVVTFTKSCHNNKNVLIQKSRAAQLSVLEVVFQSTAIEEALDFSSMTNRKTKKIAAWGQNDMPACYSALAYLELFVHKKPLNVWFTW